MGIIGVAISSSFQFMIRFGVTLGYIMYSEDFKAPEIQVPLFGAPENFLNWKTQIYLSLQCMSLSIWAWWAMDIFTLIATEMPAGNLTAQHIMRNITLLTFMIPVGIMASAGIMVGNNIGANKVATAKAYGMMCFKTGLIWALCTIALLTLFKGPFTGLFSSE
jgi:multidrug resistance protein, MATE family